jgi:phage terminase Nu1 subunit (DNA packaging protein)
MANLTTVAKWAETLGISRQQGYAAVKRCEIALTDGMVDTEYATILYHRHTRPRANGKRTADVVPPAADVGAIPNYDESRAKREAAEASIAEMKEAEMRGKYLQKTEVDSAIFEIARAMRDGLTNCARRIAADVAGLPNAEDCEAVIDREHRALLESMAHRVTTKLGASADQAGESV